MLDFSRIRTPPRHGDVLIEPPPSVLAEWAVAGGRTLDGCDVPLLDTTLGDERRSIRRRLLGGAAGATSAAWPAGPVVVTGHQPDFIHPGVWAKQIVAARLAQAVSGRGVNLVVDSDAAKEAALRIPVAAARAPRRTLADESPVARARALADEPPLAPDTGLPDGDEVRVTAVRYADVPAGWTFDQIPAPTPSRMDDFENQIREGMGDRFQRSMMPPFLHTLRQAGDAADWVEAMIRARRAVESSMGVNQDDLRVSGLPMTAMMADWMLNASRLVECYNGALARYRRRYGVRSPHRPIPDLLAADTHTLHTFTPLTPFTPFPPFPPFPPSHRPIPDPLAGDGHPPSPQPSPWKREGEDGPPPQPSPSEAAAVGRWELPLWAIRRGEARRRCFVEPAADLIRVWADDIPAGVVPAAELARVTSAEAALRRLNGWRLHPRALALTTWARLFLADVFIHGIGGAKYDRITDDLIRSYYGIEPPPYACVSATWLMDLPRNENCGHRALALRHAWRDLRYNPQRRLQGGADLDEPIRQRREALARATRLAVENPADRAGRRAAFEAIRSASAAMLAQRPGEVEQARRALQQAAQGARSDEAAAGREYFFGLYDRASLQKLLAALPDEAAFAV